MTTTFFITRETLLKYTDLPDTLDELYFNTSVRRAQDERIESIIGTKLYERLMDGALAGDLNQDEIYLLKNYITDALIYWTYYYVLESVGIQVGNNGVVRKNGGQNGDPTNDVLLRQKQSSIESTARYHSETLSRYLIEEGNKYPQYNEQTDLHEKQPDHTTQYKTPFVLGRAYNRGSNNTRYGLPSTDSTYWYLPPHKRP